ncbi:MAG: DUF6259 domain-containing protein [Thermoguttaceae bacterium]|nr:DUF6259 domain-containing protein [Thermoguttaceae bacterium]
MSGRFGEGFLGWRRSGLIGTWVAVWATISPAVVLSAEAPPAGQSDQIIQSPAGSSKEQSAEQKTTASSALKEDALLQELQNLLQQESERAAKLPAQDRPAAYGRIMVAQQLLADNRPEEARRLLKGQIPPGMHFFYSGDLGMGVESAGEGVRLLAVYDGATGRRLSAAKSLPLFSIRLRHSQTKQMVTLSAQAGWRQVQMSRPAEDRLVLRWERPADEQLDQIQVETEVQASAPNRFGWTLRINLAGSAWSVWEVVFPQMAVAPHGPEAAVFFPRGPGEVQRGLWEKKFHYSGLYPNGWTSMAFLAAYAGDGSSGLYLAMHDPVGSTKEIRVESRPEEQAVLFVFEHPAPNMGQPGNGFQLPGQAVWQLLRGDWFDAAMIYRDWVRREAGWFPKLGPEGREDTPQWMRELPAWALSSWLASGKPEQCVSAVKAFREYLGVPIGVHWYNWHQIPFDNDYPHYFPTKEGFSEGVRQLQEAGVYVMPYINGRLWDTRDKGLEDFQFSQVARPAATKDENGQAYTEVYGSKEADGSPVRLAVMCPSTPLWQGKVQEIVRRLFDDCGVKAVYIDQVAAAQPRLCFDSAHGHPLGGGHWWTESYWKMLLAIRQQKPPDRMLTTECNAEPFIHCFDGYLTWHWQHDGQVPAFPAVYGGAIQMFGRAYRGGPTKDLALRMKAGQQLVFGEQIGWIDPGIIREKENAEFLRQVVSLRWAMRRYFYAGQMARPPKLVGPIPRVTADWQWSGHWPVSTDALLSGAWMLPDQQKLLLLFANVGDEPVRLRLEFDAAGYGLSGSKFRWVRYTPEGHKETLETPRAFHQDLSFPSRQVCAWECSPLKD